MNIWVAKVLSWQKFEANKLSKLGDSNFSKENKKICLVVEDGEHVHVVCHLVNILLDF